MPKFTITEDGVDTKEQEINSFPCIIGRGEHADISFEHDSISDSHCIIEESDQDITVTDLSSETGTFVNGEQVTNSTLKPGDMLTVGIYSLTLKHDDDTVTLPADISDEDEDSSFDVTMKRDTEAETEEKNWSLKVLGKDISKHVVMDRHDYIIGTEEDCDITLKGWSVDKKHALITRDEMGVRLINVSDKKPVCINEQEMHNRKKILSSGDTVSIGPYTITVKEKT